MKPGSSEGASRIQALLGSAFTVLEFEQSTHTAAEAAAAIGCDVAQIAKSLLFRAADGQAGLVVASGANRVDETKVAALLGQEVGRADPDFVLRRTGFAVGGVPPVGYEPGATLLDQDLQLFATIWASAGSANAVFALSPVELVRLTRSSFADVAKRR